MKVGVVWDPIFAKHDMGRFHPESPRRALAVKEVLDELHGDANIVSLATREASKEEVARVHDINYIEKLEQTQGATSNIFLDPDTSVNAYSYRAALMSAGAGLVAIDEVMAHHIDNAFAFTRPPGHHAEYDHSKGFCLFNNIAVAAEYALQKYGLKRVAIIDIDVHHGNGSQSHFYERSDVFFASSHRHPFYPGSGHESEKGDGEGKGFNLNVNFRALSGDDEFKAAYEKVIFPAIEKYSPELILVSAGFDAHEDDPLGGLRLKTSTYGWFTREIKKIAAKSAEGRVIYFLEGGYDTAALKQCVREVVGELEK